MIEFGEKIKQLREEKGMTQQTMADHLYVTRQAVSRWECGARYPDLLTTKKIAEILEVSIDELVSGEELKHNVEKEPILAESIPNMIQTALYAIGATAYVLMCIFSLKSFFPDQALKEALAGTPAGTISVLEILTVAGYLLQLTALMFGLFSSVKNVLSPLRAGIIMSVSYLIELLLFTSTLLNTLIKRNGTVIAMDGLYCLFLIFAIIVICFFFMGRRKFSPLFIYVLVLPRVYVIVQVIRKMRLYSTELGFVVRSTHLLGVSVLIALFVYQAYVLDRKRKAAIK